MRRQSATKRFVITGMSGTGKTAVLEALRREGRGCFEEPARKLLQAHLPEDGDYFAPSFISLMLQQSLADFEAADSGVAFYDRGLPDTVAYAIRFGVDAELCRFAAQTHRYESEVFVAPPWPEIFERDEYRRATYEDYLKFHDLLLKTYRDLGYSLVDLPKVPVSDRVRFIQSYVGQGT